MSDGSWRVELPQERPPHLDAHRLYEDHIDLAPLLTAVRTARLFVRSTLRRWNALNTVEDADVITSELVTNAVKFTGHIHPQPVLSDLPNFDLLCVRVLGLQTSIVLEVWDGSEKPPIIPPQSDELEGGRGLLLVRGLSKSSGYYLASAGKVVWAELPVHRQAVIA